MCTVTLLYTHNYHLWQALLQEHSLSHVRHFTPWDLDKRMAFLITSKIGDADFKCICLKATQGVGTDMVRSEDIQFICNQVNVVIYHIIYSVISLLYMVVNQYNYCTYFSESIKFKILQVLIKQNIQHTYAL